MEETQENTQPTRVHEAVLLVKQASWGLAQSSSHQRNRGLAYMAEALEQDKDAILEANTLDLEASQDMAVPALVQEWLKLTPERLQGAIAILRDLSRLPDPLGQTTAALHQPAQAQSYCQRFSLGVVALISEAFPALGAIAAGLCLRTGNALLVRGGSETSHSNRAIFASLRQALEQAELPMDSLFLLPNDQGEAVLEILEHQADLDLIIPYGRASLVNKIIKGASAPIIRPGIGNCYLYWGASAPLDLVRSMLLDSHRGEPDRVNALEKVLLPPTVNTSHLERLWRELQQQGFEVRVDESLKQDYPELALATAEEWGKAYWSRHPVVAFRGVSGLPDAIASINRNSSGHANAIATGLYDESRLFSQTVRSTATYVNISPRFKRHPGHAEAVALGMACGRGCGTPRHDGFQGRIGIEALTRTSQIILG